MNVDKKNGNEDVCGIYCISNTKYFYIGLSIHVYERWGQHKRHLKRGTHHNKYMQRVYNKYQNIDPFEYELLCVCDRQELPKLEKKYYDIVLNESNKLPLNEQECGKSFFTEEAIRKSKKSHSGKKFSKETRRKISENQKGHKRPDKRIPIVQLDQYGKLIKIWYGGKTEIEEVFGHNIHTYRKTCYGFQWQKYDEWLINPKGEVKYVNVHAVIQYSLDSVFIKKYKSIQEAVNDTGIRHCNISNAVTGKQKTAGGFIWMME